LGLLGQEINLTLDSQFGFVSTVNTVG
jgi:hypothetical protein